MTKLGVAATNRASFYLYTVPEEIDRLAAGLLQGRGDVRCLSSTRCTAR